LRREGKGSEDFLLPPLAKMGKIVLKDKG